MGSNGFGAAAMAKRVICINCTKPMKLCLCSRFEFPPLDNAVRITVLQHEHEVKHPLNSTRVAKLGLRNLEVVVVSDVNLNAEIVVRPLEDGESERERLGLVSNDFSDTDDCVMKKEMNFCKVMCSNSELKIYLERTAKPDLNWVLNTPLGRKLITNGFQVKKIHTKKKHNSTGSYETEEYNITIPPNSALLFLNEKSTNINSIDFEVKNLIVLDGTWAKAQRMYHENPWLKILPHLKLDLKMKSLYSEVRHEPKEGCLSTIESIVFAMKELGDDFEGLDSILGVFESMVLDQRRCKDERLCVSSPN